MYRLYLLILAIFILPITGCVTLQNEPESISILKQNLAQDPENLQLIGKLADEYRSLWSKDKNTEYEQKAYFYYKKYLKKSPGHIGASVAYYALSSKASIHYGILRNKEDLFSIYKDIGLLKKVNVMPPSFVELIVEIPSLNGPEGHKKVIKMGKNALKENINFIPTYLVLSEEYDLLGQNALSDLMLKQAQKINPEHPKLLKAIAEKATLHLQDTLCSKSYDKTVEDIVNLNKKALHENPKDPDLNYNLSFAYSALGKFQLALFYAKKSVSIENNFLNATNLIDQYMHSLEFERAEKVANDLLSEKKYEKDVWSILGLLYFQGEQWEKAFNAFNKSKALGKDLTVYNTIRHFLSAKILGDLNQANTIIKNYPLSPDEAEFEKALLDYYKGNINQEVLLSRSKSVCDETEAKFFIGMQAYADNDIKTAREYFQKVLDLRIYPYYQYNAAKFRMSF